MPMFQPRDAIAIGSREGSLLHLNAKQIMSSLNYFGVRPG